MADSPDAAAAAMAQAMGSIAAGWSGLLGGFAAKLAAGANSDVDPAAAEQVRAQMTAMLQDPAVANSPTATFLQAFLQEGERRGTV
jgi:hypothetical protein